MNFTELAQSRRSIRQYDTSQPVTDDLLADIFRDVVLSPSAFNLQQWLFVVVRDPAQKKRLRAAAMDQQQVENCGAVVVVCGKLDAHQDAERIYTGTPDEVRQRVVGMTAQFYGGNPQLARDEAIRGASMAAMSLMFAARDRGLDTGPMIGFDPAQVSQVLGLPENVIPAMMIVMGKGEPAPMPRGYRRPLDEVVRLERYDGDGLAG